MNVKIYFLTLLTALAVVGCVDDSYDLTKVTSDDIVIGDDDSVFEAPVATITLTRDNFIGASTRASILTFDEVLTLVNGFLPSGESVDIAVLVDDATSESEATRLVSLLIDELMVSDSKCQTLADVFYSYTSDLDNEAEVAAVFDYFNINTESGAVTTDDIHDAFMTLRTYDEAEVGELNELLVDVFLNNIVDGLNEYIDIEVGELFESVSVPSDIVDLISDYADILSIVVTYEHNYPFTLNFGEFNITNYSASPSSLTLYDVTAKGETTIPMEVDFNELVALLESGNSMNIYTSFSLAEYLSNDTAGDYWLKLKISVIKKGGILL